MRRRARRKQDIAWVAVLLGLAILTRPARISAAAKERRIMTLDEVRALAASVGFSGSAIDIAAAIAMAESDGDPWAQGDPHGPAGPTPNGSSTSFGLWQIHQPDHLEFNAGDLLTTDYNARAAFLISKGGTDFSLWSTYNAPPSDPRSYLHWMPGGANA